MTIVVALGGNAGLRAGDRRTAAEQRARIRETCAVLQPLLEEDVVLTHGNGPRSATSCCDRSVRRPRSSRCRGPPRAADRKTLSGRGRGAVAGATTRSPKVEASIDFARATGGETLIALQDALARRAGMRITP